MKDFEDIYRKINIRKEAENNMNCIDANNIGQSSKKINLDSLEDKVIKINSFWSVDYDFQIHSHRKIIGRFIIFSKRAVRKLLKWYVKDTGIKQNTFNSYSVQVINGMWDYINELNRKNQDLENNINKLNGKLDNNISESNDKLDNNISELNNKLDNNISELKDEIDNNISGLNDKIDNNIMDSFEKKFDDIINDVNSRMIKSNEDISYLRYRIKCLNDKKGELKLEENKYEKLDSDMLEDTKFNDGIDYFDFENKFRGSESEIQKRQEVYLPYFKNTNKVVIDIGCGRGEFLTILSQNNILCKGIDLYPDFVEYCKYKGLDVELGDAIYLLSKLEDNSLGGIFMGQIAEHLETNYLIRLLNLCRDKICLGGKIIVETQNPETLQILSNAFYIDPSHIKPIHPLQLKYIVEAAGFKNIETLYLQEFEEKIPYPIGIDNSKEFNNSIDNLNKLLYGPRDYSIIGTK